MSVGNCFWSRVRKSSSAIWEMFIGVWETSQKGIELVVNSI